MNAARANESTGSWWRGWWRKLDTIAAAVDDASTDYLLDRMRGVEGSLREMRAEFDALKAPGGEP